MPNVGQELLNVPFPEMVLKLASAIAEGQFKLDQVSCQIAKFMGSDKTAPVFLPDLTSDDPEATIKTSLIGAGFQPTFYQFTDTIIEVKMAITMNQSSEATFSTSASGGFMCFAASVNASFSSKYSYSVEGFQPAANQDHTSSAQYFYAAHSGYESPKDASRSSSYN